MKIGVDVGGTNIRAGLVDEKTIVKSEGRPLRDKDNLGSTLDQLKSIIHSVFDKRVKGIGLGVPSVLDLENGIVYNAVNISSWKEVPLREILEKEFGVPIFINNDSNCFVLGEKYYGFGQPFKNVVGITLGTGIGSGIIIDNKLYSGTNCGAGEIGYLPYLEHDFEYYCGANFFSKHQTTGRQTFTAAQSNDPKALELLATFGSHIGVAIKSVVYTYDPQAVVIGGAISKAFPYFEEQMLKSMRNTYFPNSISKLKIHVSELEHVAMLGAAAQVDQYLTQ